MLSHTRIPVLQENTSLQVSKAHIATIGLLFYSARGKYCINHFTCADSNQICSFAETVSVPFQISLVVCRHMLYYCGVLSWPSIEMPVRRDPIVIKNISIVVSVIRTLTFSLIY